MTINATNIFMFHTQLFQYLSAFFTNTLHDFCNDGIVGMDINSLKALKHASCKI